MKDHQTSFRAHRPRFRGVPCSRSRGLALGLLLALTAPLGAQDAPTVPGPDALVRAEFQRLCQSFYQGPNIYWGIAQLPPLEARIEKAGSPAEKIRLQGELALELIRLGRTAEALEVLDEATAISRQIELGEGLELDLTIARALGHLRLGEQINCLQSPTHGSCILPVRHGGVHAVPEHARRAADLLVDYLAKRPGDLQARWLVNLTHMLAGSYPQGVPEALRLPPGTLDSKMDFPRWHDIAPELGVAARDLAGGAVMDDFDGDGLLDLITSTSDPCGSLKAFRNTGLGGFEEVTRRWGLDVQLGGLNLLHADFDNDGHLDLLVLRGAWLGDEGRIRNSLLRNDLHRATGRFTDVTDAAGLAEPAYPTQAAAWADFDGDGDLDLYVGNEFKARTFWPSSLFRDPGYYDPFQLFRQPQPLNVFALLVPSNIYPSQLFRNNGDGTFTDVAEQAGVTNHRMAKGVTWGDYDNDGDPDLFVANLGPNRLYRNNGDGTFTDVAAQAGAAEPASLSFTSWFFDYDNDGDLDLFVADYTSRIPEVVASYMGRGGEASNPPALLRNDGGRFTNVAREVGLGHPWLPMGANFGDLDNDGWLDIYLGTGSPDFDNLMPNVMLRNVGGTRFEDVTFAGGFGHLQKGHGIAFGDLDNDGDQDLLQQMGGALLADTFGNVLYENPGAPGSWVTLRLIGQSANRFGVGARIEVRVRRGEQVRSIYAVAGSGGSFGASSLQQEIGLGDAEAIESITVRWPGSGTVQIWRGIEPGRAYELVEGRQQPRKVVLPRIRLGVDGPSGRPPSETAGTR